MVVLCYICLLYIVGADTDKTLFRVTPNDLGALMTKKCRMLNHALRLHLKSVWNTPEITKSSPPVASHLQPTLF